MDNEKINIAVTIDDNYLKPLIVMLTSLFKNNRAYKFCIFLVYSDLTSENIQKIDNLISIYKQEFITLRMDDLLFEKATSVAHVSKETFYRLLLPELLPESIEKILYLDPDIIINGDINKLYSRRFNGKMAIAAKIAVDVSRWNNSIKRYRIPKKAIYFNAGVMLFNIKAMRKSPLFQKDFIIDFVRINNGRFTDGDQACLNVLLWDKTIILNCNIYNYDTRFYYDKNKMSKFGYLLFLIREQRYANKHSIIIHYRGASKPWNYDYTGKMWNVYWKYEAETEFKRGWFKLCLLNKLNNFKELIKILK